MAELLTCLNSMRAFLATVLLLVDAYYHYSFNGE